MGEVRDLTSSNLLEDQKGTPTGQSVSQKKKVLRAGKVYPARELSLSMFEALITTGPERFVSNRVYLLQHRQAHLGGDLVGTDQHV